MNRVLPASTQGTVWANSQAPEALQVGVWNWLSWKGMQYMSVSGSQRPPRHYTVWTSDWLPGFESLFL